MGNGMRNEKRCAVVKTAWRFLNGFREKGQPVLSVAKYVFDKIEREANREREANGERALLYRVAVKGL